jgi:hypothetical protein
MNMARKFGRYFWACPICSFRTEKNTPQEMELAKSNHLRKHRGKKVRQAFEKYFGKEKD